jgi:lipopolysaccharide transport system permease protein
MLPVLIGLQYLLTLGPLLILSAANVYFRDLQHIILHLLMVAQFLTPIFYPASIIPESLRAWAFVNPLAVLVSSFQDVLYHNRFPAWPPLAALLALGLVLLSLAAPMFARYKRNFAEAL